VTDAELETKWKQVLKLLWLRVFVALNKAAALGVTICVHKGLDVAAKWVIDQPGWQPALQTLRATFFVVFSLVYVHFVWEMLTTFIPNVGWKRLKSEGQNVVSTPEPVQE
jgi:hypothetical protein